MATKMKETIIKLSRSKGKNKFIVIYSLIEILLLMLSYSFKEIDKILYQSFEIWILSWMIWLALEAIENEELAILMRYPLIYTVLSDMNSVVFLIAILICRLLVKIFENHDIGLNNLKLAIVVIGVAIIMFGVSKLVTSYFKKKLSS